ncbi:ribosome maturation factor RimP [Thermotalea metallivorans]|uniref:Ribosome maturation factor RimP n=1 Tax=Thermotalea metallivorans TaxID=520762 RepID=A0A140L5G6_9FIRM|nr:ribosome maturation factor RimP [Thermotalea metallivorans]KXG75791.1 Ribosome maturation factor RimP [Thermotalea metallivorans]
MSKKRIVDIAEELVMPVIRENNFELVDIEYVKEGKDRFLRVYIDHKDGITLDDCQKVSEYLSDRLDEVDPIEESYYLEVSSPGLDRPLKKDEDFERFKGRMVEVYLYQAVEGKKVMEGELLGLIDNHVAIKVNGHEIFELSRDKVAKVKLAVIME